MSPTQTTTRYLVQVLTNSQWVLLSSHAYPKWAQQALRIAQGKCINPTRLVRKTTILEPL